LPRQARRTGKHENTWSRPTVAGLEKARADLASGLLQLGQKCGSQDRHELDLEVYTAAEDQVLRLLAGTAGSMKYQEFLVLAQLNLGSALARAERPGPALAAFRKSAATLDKVAPSLPRLAVFRKSLLTNCTRIGDQLGARGQNIQALQAYQQAVHLGKKLVAGRTDDVKQRAELFAIQARVCVLCKRLDRRAEAVAAYRDQLAGLEDWAEKQPKALALQGLRGSEHMEIGRLVYDQGKTPDAVAEFGTGIALLEDALK
jgi:hypothetical protein